MAITAAMVKELRERTGLGMMDCKRALTEANGDMELAIENLRKNSALKAAKKSDRTAAEGLLGVRVADDGQRAVLVEVNIETDFAAKNEKFVAFVDQVADAYYASEESFETLAAGELEQTRQALVQEIGENITLRRGERIVADGGHVYSYLHTDKRKATLVELSGANAELGRDIALHVTGIDPPPLVVSGEQLPADVLEKEREIFSAQAAESGKPPEIVEKMVDGRVRKFMAEVSLLDQPFVKDSSMKVGGLLKDHGLECRGFVRFAVGEGIDVEKTDFAEEVAQQLGQ